MRRVRLYTGCALLALSPVFAEARIYDLKSPDGRNKVEIETDGNLNYSFLRDNTKLLNKSLLSMTVDGKEWGINAKCKGVIRSSSNKEVVVPVPRRFKTLRDNYNALTLNYKGYNVEFRAYDNGIAYRFVSTDPKANEINAEVVNYNFAGNPRTYTQLTDRLQQWFEYNYTERAADSLPTDSLIILPMLARTDKYNIMLAEADVYDYPGLYLRPGNCGLEGVLAAYPATEKTMENGNKRYVDKREKFLVNNAGKRTFPWRVAAVCDNDAELLANEIVYLLASEKERNVDFSWVKPGKVLWDWWNCWNVYGVDFKAGKNTATYKYLIDWATRNGLEYVLFDEGWSAPFDLLTLAPDVDMEEVCRYASEKGVGVLLWTKWVNLDRQMTEALDMMAKWGVKGIKVDFMDRNDAAMVNFYEKVAEETAKRQMLVNFHGSYPPDGMRRRYPNIMTREGVYGLENNKWSDRVTPKHDVLLSYIRQFSGPMDYTPGAMLNAHGDKFHAIHDEPMSQGTRSHQVALYVVFESPLQTLADSPVHYDANPLSCGFIKKIPTVWDETVPLAGEMGEYVAVAKRKGNDWYIGAINGTEKPIHIDISLDFLPEGEWTITYHSDGVNSDIQAKDFKVETKRIAGSAISIAMARGGGYAAIITNRVQ